MATSVLKSTILTRINYKSALLQLEVFSVTSSDQGAMSGTRLLMVLRSPAPASHSILLTLISVHPR